MSDDWIECGLPWWDKMSNPESFNNKFKEADLVGLLVEIDGKQFLIGDVNTSSGRCDCCAAFEYDAIVTRYKRVWSPAAD